MAKENPRPPSSEFMDVLINSGSPVRDCDFCERTHFVDPQPGIDWEEGEYEDLMEKHHENPDKYIHHGNATDVHWGTLNGQQYVDGCPCNSARAYEDFIWSHRHLIAGYIQKRVETERKAMQEDSELAQKISDSNP